MEAQKDCLVRAISKDGFVNVVAVYTRGLTERARPDPPHLPCRHGGAWPRARGLFDDGQRTQG